MKPSSLRARLVRFLVQVGFLAGAPLLLAQPVIVESRTSDSANSITPCPPYCEVAPAWSSSGTKSGATGTNPNRVGSRFGSSGTPSVTIQPTLLPGITYQMDITHISPNSSPNIVVNIAYSGCTGSASSTTAFQTGGAGTWETVGTITVDAGVTQPQITFTYASGTLAGTGGRWYVDAFRFVSLADPCVSALPELTAINGPLANGQTYVDVPGVNGAATAVKVYANGVIIGTLTSNIVAGVNRVPTSPLVKGQIISATQMNSSNVDSCRPTTGPVVGSGAPRLRLSLSVRQNTALTGPIGTNGGTTGTPLVFIAATGTWNSGSAVAPLGGKVLQPGNCWQTVAFTRGPDPAAPVDPTYIWISGTPGMTQLQGDYATVESLGIAIDDLTDSGPYKIYLDNFMNGTNVIQDFEAAANGQNGVLFNQPSFSSTTSPFLLPGLNESVVTNAAADSGSQSLLVQWQFKDTYGGDWLRLTAQGSGTPNPVVDLRLPISFRILLLPAGITNAVLGIGTQPANVAVTEGESATLRVEACGTPPIQYQWYFNSNQLSGAVSNTLNIARVYPTNAGSYQVVVSDLTGSVTSSPAILAVESRGISGIMTQLWALSAERYYLVPDNQQGGMTYLPMLDLLVVVSRSMVESIRTLSANSGADYAAVDWGDTAVVTGGLYRFHKVGATSDGTFITGNVTVNAAVSEFRLYQSFYDQGPLSLIWHGNPGGAGDNNRWGDTMDVRDYGEATISPQVILAAYADNKVAVLTPATNTTGATTFVVSNAPPGAFAHGLSWGEGNTFWGKSFNGALYHVGLDFTTGRATILHTYFNVPTLAAIKVNVADKLLGGVAIGTPDTLRLYNIADLSIGPVRLDTAVFPTDHSNPGYVGSVTFSPGRIYALDGNNGILAMRLVPLVRAEISTNLTIHWTGPGVLQSATNVAGPYLNVPGATKPHPVVTSEAGRRFYRVME